MTLGGLSVFIQGLLLLLLAGFIIGAINYIASNTPESTLGNNNNNQPPPYLVRNITGYIDEQVIGVVIDPIICTYQYNFYVVVDLSNVSRDISPFQVNVLYTNPQMNEWSYSEHTPIKYGSTRLYYSEIPLGSRCLYYVEFLIDRPSSGQVFIYLFDTPDINQSLKALVSNPSPVVSNKPILSIIGWISGIALIITALHKLGVLK
jgi:hypothetical protein